MSNLFNIIIFVVMVFLLCNSTCFAQYYSYMGSQDEKLKDCFYKGVDYINNQQYDKAIPLLEEAYKINPKQMQVIGELCFSYAQTERYDDMLKIAKKGLYVAQSQLSKDNIGRFYGYIGNAYKMLKNYDEAIKNLQLAIYNKPHYMDNYLSMAYCYSQKEAYDTALETYETIKIKDPDYYEKNNLEASRNHLYQEALSKDYAIKHLDLGQKYRREKQYDEAINEYKKILEKEPEDITSLMETIRNQSLRNSGNYDEIIELCNKTLNILNRRETRKDLDAYEMAYKGLSFSYKKLNKTSLYEEYKKLYVSIDHLKNAKEYLSTENAEKCLEEYTKAIQIISDLEEAPYNYAPIDGLIELLFSINELEEANKYISLGIKQARKDNNNNKLAKYNKDLATYYSLQGDYAKAETYYKKGLELTTDKDDKFKFCLGLALCCSVAGDIKEELNYYEKCKQFLSDDAVEMITDLDSSIIRCKAMLDENSDLSLSMKHLANGEKYLESKKYNEAVNEFAKSLKYIPQRLDTLQKLSVCLQNINKIDEAKEVNMEGFMTSIRDRDEFYIDIFSIILGNYYYEKEDYRQALKYYNYVTGANPNFPPKTVFSLIGTCHLLLHEIDKAVKAYEIANKIDPSDEKISNQLKLCRELLNKE